MHASVSAWNEREHEWSEMLGIQSDLRSYPLTLTYHLHELLALDALQQIIPEGSERGAIRPIPGAAAKGDPPPRRAMRVPKGTKFSGVPCAIMSDIWKYPALCHSSICDAENGPCKEREGAP